MECSYDCHNSITVPYNGSTHGYSISMCGLIMSTKDSSCDLTSGNSQNIVQLSWHS